MAEKSVPSTTVAITVVEDCICDPEECYSCNKDFVDSNQCCCVANHRSDGFVREEGRSCTVCGHMFCEKCVDRCISSACYECGDMCCSDCDISNDFKMVSDYGSEEMFCKGCRQKMKRDEHCGDAKCDGVEIIKCLRTVEKILRCIDDVDAKCRATMLSRARRITALIEAIEADNAAAAATKKKRKTTNSTNV